MKLITRRSASKLAISAGVFALSGKQAVASGGAIDRIKKAGSLRVGVDAGFPPFSFRDTSGQIVGYDLDLANEFGKSLGVQATLVDTQWSGIIPSLYAGHFDMIMGGISYTKERAERVAFTIPYAEASQALLIRAAEKEKIKSIDDMSGRVIAVKLASPAENIVKQVDARLQKDRGKGFAAVKTYDDLPAAYLALAQGTVDAVMNSIATMSVVMRDRPGIYTLVKGVGADSWCCVACRKEDTDLVAFLDQELLRMRRNGQIYEFQEKWFQFRMPLPDQRPGL
jgi:polar amino acid transport system substrate-binding protein